MINKRIMIIGGTGALGKQLTERWKVGNEILIFSRNEHKQEEMKRTYPDALYRIGDVKDKESILRSMYEFQPSIIVNTDKCVSYKKVPETLSSLSQITWHSVCLLLLDETSKSPPIENTIM